MKLTNEQLSALPEYNDSEIIIQEDGTTKIQKITPKFIARKTNPEDIVIFSDESGVYRVIYNIEGGPYKERLNY